MTGVSFEVPESFTISTDEMTQQLSSWLIENTIQIVRGPESRTLINPVPDFCNVCGHDNINAVGRVGHCDGKTGGGDMHAATCPKCDTSWIASFGSNPTPWNIADDPWW